MKNLFLSVVLLLTVSFAFAANDVENVSTADITTVEMISSVELANADFVDVFLSPEFENSFNLVQVENITLSDCSGITVTLGGGDSFVWSGSCAGLMGLIRAYLAK